MVMIVFKIRRIRLLSSAPLNTLKTLENLKMFEIIEDKLLSLKQHNQEQQLFYIDLFYQISRIWEGYCKDKDGKVRFEFKQKKFLQNRIVQHFNCFIQLFRQPIELADYENETMIQSAQFELIKNIKILQFIYQQKITEDLIVGFIKQVKFIKIVDQPTRYFAFCSLNSTRVYIKLDAYHHQIEAVLIESLFYRLLNNQDPLIILSEGQQRLYIEKDLYEPGDYYNKKVHNFNIFFPSPFRMLANEIETF
ncbi:hypothetical protein pb186bvf_020307 [Paramecium bursaria]